MKCKNCGAGLSDTDKFCAQCGWKVVRARSCPECGASLREGAKFCPKCGRLLDGGHSPGEGKVFVKDAETSEIPIADIEQNILTETERELHKSEKTGKPKKPKKPGPAQEREVPRAKKPLPAPEPKKREKPAPVRKKVYEEWDDEEDDDEDEDDGFSIMTIVSVVMAFLILAVAAFLIFSMVRQQPVKDYGEDAQEEQDSDGEDNEYDGEDGEISDVAGNGEDTQEPADGMQPVGTLSIVSNVNVRDNPSTEGTNIIKVAKEGETYEYIGTAQDGNWYIILLEDGSTGYVFEQYVSVD